MLSPQSARPLIPPPLSPRDLAHNASEEMIRRRPSQRQMLEMAFEGESHVPTSSSSYGDSDVEGDVVVSPRSSSSRNGAYAVRSPRSARLSAHELERSSGGSWHDLSTVLVPTTPSHAVLHGTLPSHELDDTVILEQDDPELFRQGVLEHAQRLGIDPHSQPELMWIARDSLVAQLPDGWVLQHASSSNSPYYYHAETGVSQWDHPMDEYFRRVVDQYKRRHSYGGGSDRMSSSEGMHTASYYEQQRGYGDGAVAAAWQDDYDSGGRLSYQSSDYQHQSGWGNGLTHDQAAGYYHGYEESSITATGSSSKGYEENSDLDVADSRSTLIVSGRQNYVRGSGATSPSVAELEALKTHLQELERKNKELEDQLIQDAAKSIGLEGLVLADVEQLKTHIEELENSNKLLEEKRNQDDGLIVKLEDQVKSLMEHSPPNTANEETQRCLEEEKDKLENAVAELQAALDKSSGEFRELQVAHESMQRDLESLQGDRSQIEAVSQEETLKMAKEIEDYRRAAAEEATKVKKLEDDLDLLREQAAAVAVDLNEARATSKKLETDLVRHAKREQDEKNDVTATASALATAEEQIESLNAQLEEVRGQLATTEADATHLRSEIATLKLQHSHALEKCSSEFQLQLAARDTEVEAKNSEVQAVKEAVRAALEEKAALESKLEEQAQLATMLKAEADDQQRTLKRDIRALERDLKALQSVSNERENEFTAAKRVIADLEQKLHEQDAIVDAAKRSAYEEAEKAAAEIIRQAHSEKARVAELYAQELQTRRKLHNRLMELQGNIRVFCRVRPIQAVELKSEQSSQAVYFRANDPETIDLVVGGDLGNDGKLLNGAGQKHPFEFDHIFQPSSSQNEVFEQTKALVTSALDGFNVCIFAYGQTGSGKTHTMEGSDADPGLYYRSLEELFKIREDRTASGDFECAMKLSMLEVYNETVVDLLDNAPPVGGLDQRKGLEIRMGKQGVYVDNLIEVDVFNEKDVTDLMKLGKSHRSVGAHDFNEHSSRSHLLLSITIETVQKTENKRRVSKLQLIDLAGSERVSKTAASGQRLKEAQNINRSLSALGDVIAALGTNSKHVPFRNSKLTFLLQECLSGNSKVLMFVNVSPVQWNAPETLCSLNFASRCRNVALGMAKLGSSSSSDTPSPSPSIAKEPARSSNSINTVPSGKQRPTVPSPSVKGTQRIVFG